MADDSATTTTKPTPTSTSTSTSTSTTAVAPAAKCWLQGKNGVRKVPSDKSKRPKFGKSWQRLQRLREQKQAAKFLEESMKTAKKEEQEAKRTRKIEQERRRRTNELKRLMAPGSVQSVSSKKLRRMTKKQLRKAAMVDLPYDPNTLNKIRVFD